MKNVTVQNLVSFALKKFMDRGMRIGTIRGYQYSGFRPFIQYCEDASVAICTDELIGNVIRNAVEAHERGDLDYGILSKIRCCGGILKRLRDSRTPNDLRTWIPKPLHLEPTKKELSSPDNIYALVWRVKKAMREFGFTQGTMDDYQGQGFYPILKAYHSAGKTEYSEEFTGKFVSLKREEYENGKLNRINCQVIRKAASMLKEYRTIGTLSWHPLPNYHSRKLSGGYAALIAGFSAYLKTLGNLKDTTQNSVLRMSKLFLFRLNDSGIESITAITPRIACEKIGEAAEHYGGGLDLFLYCLRVFFGYLYDSGKTAFDLCKSIPDHIPRRKRIRDGFTDTEIKSLLSSLDTTTSTGKRDYAVILLAAKTGLRACDVANLKRTDIDWRNKEIRIVQEKTGVPLSLPLPIDAGNATAEYILNGRPASDSPNVFLTYNSPYRPLTAKSLASIVSRVMQRANIIDVPNRRRRFHSLRRYFGRQLLEARTSLDMLGELLGQRDMNAAKPYVATFEDDLKLCVLGLVPLRGTVE